MLKKLGYAGMIGGALIAFPLLAQAADDTFVKEQATNQWRASKLVGVSVMGLLLVRGHTPLEQAVPAADDPGQASG